MTRQNIRNVVVIAVTAAVILAGLWLARGGWWSGGASSSSSPSASVAPGQAAPAVGAAAPDFTATTIDGQAITLSKMTGEPTWLIFGATWCADCRVEAPDVEAVAQAYSGRVQVVAVYVGEDTSTVQPYVQRIGLTMPAVADTANSIADAYDVVGIPVHYFIDASGVIKAIHVGAISQQSAGAQLDALLGS